MKVLARVVLLSLLASGVVAEVRAADDAPAAIDAANKAFMQAFAKGDAAALAAMYTEEATAFPPSGQPVQGRAAITALWQGLIDSKGTEFTLKTTEVRQLGEMAFETGRYTVKPPTGQAVEGNYLVMWKREKGSWKLHRDIWN